MPHHNFYSAAFAACLATVTGPALAQASVKLQQPTVKFTTSHILMAAPSADAGFTACQPLRGDLAKIIGNPQQAYGTEIFPLRVTTGRCAGTSGWAGAARIETADSVAPVSSSEGLQFSSSDSLFDSFEPNTVKASCQPLRGDGAEIIGSAKFAGIEIHRVSVLTGRCQGATGWVGAEQLERGGAARSQ